ncbi:MAG: hypothetical protein KAV87_04775 [Desulfobacteraceae bacterium]|nr:hypothetical protein [Desulfobacteraceae bacterium]
MAQLHQIIGAILRDIAQARVTSDIYSREVSLYYEQDSLLRTFPIPRSEIREVNIDLRFAISEVTVDLGRTEEREARIARIFERYSERIVEDVFDNLRGSGNIREIKEWQDLVQQLASSALPLELKNQF